jgi:hypothetical protein
MFTDLHGKPRLKVGLHTHTTLSDGHKTPEEVAALYKAAGYDAIALTDHWVYGAARELGGLTILSGCEYNVTGTDEWTGVQEVYHIVGVGMTRDPAVPEDYLRNQDGRIRDRVRHIVRLIREAGGLAVLAHPAWSLNTSEQILGCGDFDATEIYNSVSDWGMSDRPYSGLIVDQIASYGMFLPLLATDDAHYYDGDQMRGITMLDADTVDKLGVAGAIKARRFYATQAPEVHLEYISEAQIRLRCTPASKLVFLSNLPWAACRVQKGSGLTEGIFTLHSRGPETFVRAEVTDENGRCGWSNILNI